MYLSYTDIMEALLLGRTDIFEYLHIHSNKKRYLLLRKCYILYYLS